MLEFRDGPVVKTLLSLPKAQFRSVVRELRSRKPNGRAQKEKKKKKKVLKKKSVKALISHSHFERRCLKKAMSKTNPGFAAQYLLNGEVLWRPSDQSAMSSIVLVRGQRNCIGRQSPWFSSPHSTLY